MQKVLAAITIVAIIAIAPSAMAGGAKVPKTLCLDWAGMVAFHQLAFKASGTIYSEGQKVKTYTITGRDAFGVISGSGHVLPNTSVLQASYSGMNGMDDYHVRFYELGFSLETGTGLIEGRLDYPDGSTVSVIERNVTSTDCSQLTITVSGDEMAGDEATGF